MAYGRIRSFDLILAGPGGLSGVMHLIPDETFNRVFSGKGRAGIGIGAGLRVG